MTVRNLVWFLILWSSIITDIQGRQIAPSKPNIVYIMADELGYFELSCMGHPHMRTPNIDRLAQEGIRFTQCLAGSAVCAPTRCCLMTGKHSGHTSVRGNGGGTPLRKGEPTVASVLGSVGYATGGYGKWGCGGRGSTGVPELHGFDEFFGYYDQVHAHSYYPPFLVRNSEEVVLKDNVGGSKGESYSHYAIMDRAEAFIRENHQQPFFCYLPITPPHGIFDIPDEDPAWSVYQDMDWPEQAKRYAAMVHMVDRQVGDLLQLLEDLKIAENTLVFFCGDNGGQDYFRDDDHPRGFHGPNVHPQEGWAFRGQKGQLYEGGLRIPMIARWKGKIAPGQVSDLLWSFPDVMPTLAELAGAEVPSDSDGLSIVPTLLGEELAGRPQAKHPFLYWEFGAQIAVRKQSWKAIRPGKAAWELYDLSEDVEEAHDLATKHPELLEELKGYARESHQPVQIGSFLRDDLHRRDRDAKWGALKPKRRGAKKTHSLDQEGLLDPKLWKVVRVSSESQFNGKLASCAIDGDPKTWWHSAFREGLQKHPHELVIDLGATRTIRGFRYLARQDQGWNGSLAQCTFHVGDEASSLDKVVAEATFVETRQSQEVRCEPVEGRFVLLRVHSSVRNGPWASIGELGVIGD